MIRCWKNTSGSIQSRPCTQPPLDLRFLLNGLLKQPFGFLGRWMIHAIGEGRNVR